MIKRLLLTLALLLPATAVQATVTTSTKTSTYTGDGSTTQFFYTFPMLDKTWFLVETELISTGVKTTLVQNQDYTVALGTTNSIGSITTTTASPVSTLNRIHITRVILVTQETTLRRQGFYDPSAIEDALDKLTMLIIQTQAAAGTSGDTAVATHEGKADAHTMYAILAGRGASQHLKGGDSTATGSGGNLQLSSTNHTIKGKVLIGSGGTELVVDDVNNNVGIGTASPSTTGCASGVCELDIAGDLTMTGDIYGTGELTLHGGDGSAEDLYLSSTTHPTKGFVYFGASGDAPTSYYRGADDTLVLDGGPDITGASLAVGNSIVGGSASIYFVLSPPSSNQVSLEVLDSGNTQALRLSSTNNANSGAEIQLYGESHATYPDDMRLTADLYTFLDEGGTEFAHLDDTASVIQSQLTTRKYHASATTGTTTLTTAACNGFLINYGDATFNLPAVATATIGCEYLFVFDGTAGAADMTLAPDGSDKIKGSCIGGTASYAQMSGVAGAATILTAGTSVKGDHIRIVNDGAGWFITGCRGIWTN